MRKPWFVFENIEHPPPRKLIALGRVTLLATRLWWVSLIWMFGFGVAAALLFAPVRGFRKKLQLGVGYGFIVPLAAMSHNMGHFLGAEIARAPMDAFLLNASIPIDRYPEKDESVQLSPIHLVRASGGPLFSALVGTIALAINSVVNNAFIRFFGIMNWFIAIGAMVPVPGIDGAVWWRELRHWRSQ
jgi:Zn-dependent protease